MVLTRSKRKHLEHDPCSPKAEIADRTISAENFSLVKISKANPNAIVFQKKGLIGYQKLSKIFQNSTATGVFGRASTQGPLNSNEERKIGEGGVASPTVVSIDDDNVTGSGKKSRSTKRSIPSIEMLIETMSETSHAKKARYDSKATFVEKYTMEDCMTVLATMHVSSEQYGLAAEKLVQGKEWHTFSLLSPPDK